MNNSFQKNAGISLIAFVVLLLFTMVLHPAGGSIEHLIEISTLIAVTHGIAIFSLPFGWIGFWGLTRMLGRENFSSVLAFAFVSIGIIAALMAAATNGLVLPIFLQHYKDSTEQIGPLLRYGFAINHAFDYIYTGAFCAAIFCWSIAILKTKKMAAWIGWAGIAISIVVVVIFGSGMAVNNLAGLRIFVTAIILWILFVGSALYRSVEDRP